MTFISTYSLFLLQCLTLSFAILITVGGIIALSSKNKKNDDLIITELNTAYQKQKNKVLVNTMQKKEFKKYLKTHKKKQTSEYQSTLFVVNFIGDIKASAVENLRKEITSILAVAEKNDEILVNIESGGGTVNSYGLGASQLERIKSKGIKLTVCVDKIAASGGYLMACVANQVIAAPFAIIGSIGVIAQLPNFNKLLKKHDIEFEQLTAGEYKRTLTMFGENTDKAREKFSEDLNDIHGIFKDHIAQHRKDIIMEDVATGEYWLGKKALDLKLVDELMTSDEYINDKIDSHKVLNIEYQTKPSFMAKLLKPAANILNHYNF